VFNFNVISISIFSLMFRFLFIWIRVTFCRFRYDMLIIVSWKVLLPLALNMFILFLFLLS
jgi:NADH:ubiquinone oxidoreductase subunit H